MMRRSFIFGSTAVWAVAMTMLVADPAFAQRGGRGGGGGGGNHDGGNRDSGRQSSGSGGSRQWSGGNQHRSSGNVPGTSNRSDGTRTWSWSGGQVRTAPSTSNQDGQRSYQGDRNQWTDNNYRWNDNNRSGNQWSSPYSGPRTQRNYPSYGNNRNSGLYGGLLGSNNYWGNYYGNNLGRSSGYYGPNGYYGNGFGYGYGSGLGNLIGLATGLSGVGGFGVPGIGLGYGGYGGYGYGGYGYSGYGPFGYNSGYNSTPYVVDRYVVDNSATTQADTYVATPATSGDFLASGKAAFLAGDYAAAQRQANHAVVENPKNAKAHELMMLSMFAQGEFQGAAAAAHAVADLGQVADWPTLYGYYKDRDKYVQHLEKLQQFAKENPNAPEGKFLLGFNYQMLGDKAQAEKQFAKYINAVNGEDPIAVKLFSSVGGDVASLPKPDTHVPVNSLDNPVNSTTQD